MVYQAQGDTVNAAQGAQVNDVIAFTDGKRIGNVATGRTQHRPQLFAGRVAALFEKILAKARLGVERIIYRAHQYQHADALTALDPAALDKLIDGPAQGMAVNLKPGRQLLLGGQIVAAAVMMAKLLLQFGGNFLISRGVTGRMSG